MKLSDISMRKSSKSRRGRAPEEEVLRRVESIECNIEDNGTSASCKVENSNGVTTELEDVGTLEMFDTEEAIADLDDLGKLVYGDLDHRCQLNFRDSIVSCHKR